MKCVRIAVFAVSVAAAASVTLAGCSSDDGSKAAPTSKPTGTTKAAATTTFGFPEPPPYTVDVQGKEIRVTTDSADPTDLLNTYNKVARTLQVSLPEGGYFIRINCATGGTDKADNRLANGTLALGKKGAAQIGGLGKFEGVVAGAHCP